jgi:hypothetical protein
MGVRLPTQSTLVMAAPPITWSMLITSRPSWITTLTVSPTAEASSRQTGRLSTDRSFTLVAPAASATTVWPMWYRPRSASCSTRPRDSSVASSRNTVDLCTPSSLAISVTPAEPWFAKVCKIDTARSTDCTAVSRGRPLLGTSERYPE